MTNVVGEHRRAKIRAYRVLARSGSSVRTSPSPATWPDRAPAQRAGGRGSRSTNLVDVPQPIELALRVVPVGWVLISYEDDRILMSRTATPKPSASPVSWCSARTRSIHGAPRTS